jgi:hypothetical protein
MERMSTAATATMTPQATDAAAALTAAGASYEEYLTGVDAVPGLFAVAADDAAITQLGLEETAFEDNLLYVGTAPKSLLGRDVRGHFHSGRTQASTLRRSLAALLFDELELTLVPRSPGSRTAKFALTPDAEDRLTAWMKEHLTVSTVAVDAADVDALAREVVDGLQPPLNLKDVAHPWETLIQKRRHLTAEARPSATL